MLILDVIFQYFIQRCW